MIERLTGKDALSALQLSRQTGVRQQSLSRWLEEARSLPVVAADAVPRRKWTAEQKARMLAEARAAGLANLEGHRSVGGMRASLYNAMPLAGAEARVAFMNEFERRHG